MLEGDNKRFLSFYRAFSCDVIAAMLEGDNKRFLSFYRAFSCDVIATMLELGKNNTFSLPWEIRFIFMQNCFIVSALEHGRRENPL